MIFRDLLLELKDGVTAAVEELFSAAWVHQTHPQDLLLIDQHGFFWLELAKSRPAGPNQLSPYVIGPDHIGLAEETLYEFIHWFRTSNLFDKSEWEQRIAQNADDQEQERLTIQVDWPSI